MTQNIFKYEGRVSYDHRSQMNGYRSVNIWFTGLSGSGKSTIAHLVERELYLMGYLTYVLDGDNIRYGICGDLGFGVDDRSENIRRVAHIISLFLDAGVITLTALISPYKQDRDVAKEIIGRDKIIEVFCDCPLSICEKRDVKGLYKKARQGIITNYTGVSSPYEIPDSPDIVLDTGYLSEKQCVTIVLNYLKSIKLNTKEGRK